MRIAHLSDIHYCDKYLEEVDRCMVAAIDHLGMVESPDLIVLSGDTFDHRLEQNSPALLTAIRRVQSLASIAPVLILQGTLSHDAPHAIDVFRHINGVHSIYVADRIEQIVLDRDGRLGGLVEGKLLDGDQLLISCLPAVNKGHVAAALGAENAAEAMGEQVAALLAGWAPSHEAARAAGIPSIVVSHGTVSGSLTEHGVPMAGLDHEFTVGSLFASRANAVMLGHIHQRQQWANNLTVAAYAGSLGRLHYGETGAKGFLLWEVDGFNTAFEFVPTPACELLDIDFPGAPDMEHLAKLAKDAPSHARVRIRYVVDVEHRASVDKAAMAALFAHCADIKVEGRIAPVQRQRAAGIGQAPSLSDKLVRWCELTTTESTPLLTRLALLLAETTVEHQQEAA